MYTILNYLVDVHAEVYDVVDSDLIDMNSMTLSGRELTTTLVNRVMASLVQSLVGAAESAFEGVMRLGQGGLLLAVLELKLLHKSLAAFCSTETEERLKDVYINRIVKVYSGMFRLSSHRELCLISADRNSIIPYYQQCHRAQLRHEWGTDAKGIFGTIRTRAI